MVHNPHSHSDTTKIRLKWPAVLRLCLQMSVQSTIEPWDPLRGLAWHLPALLGRTVKTPSPTLHWLCPIGPLISVNRSSFITVWLRSLRSSTSFDEQLWDGPGIVYHIYDWSTRYSIHQSRQRRRNEVHCRVLLPSLLHNTAAPHQHDTIWILFRLCNYSMCQYYQLSHQTRPLITRAFLSLVRLWVIKTHWRAWNALALVVSHWGVLSQGLYTLFTDHLQA